MRGIILFILVFYSVGCINDKKIPKDILAQNEMREIMWDMMRADAYVNEFMSKDSTIDVKKEREILYEKIFRIHSTSLDIFNKSVKFYERRPDLLKPIADSLKSDEKKALEEQDYIKKPEADTTFRKMRISKKLNENAK